MSDWFTDIWFLKILHFPKILGSHFPFISQSSSRLLRNYVPIHLLQKSSTSEHCIRNPNACFSPFHLRRSWQISLLSPLSVFVDVIVGGVEGTNCSRGWKLESYENIEGVWAFPQLISTFSRVSIRTYFLKWRPFLSELGPLSLEILVFRKISLCDFPSLSLINIQNLAITKLNIRKFNFPFLDRISPTCSWSERGRQFQVDPQETFDCVVADNTRTRFHLECFQPRLSHYRISFKKTSRFSPGPGRLPKWIFPLSVLPYTSTTTRFPTLRIVSKGFPRPCKPDNPIKTRNRSCPSWNICRPRRLRHPLLLLLFGVLLLPENGRCQQGRCTRSRSVSDSRLVLSSRQQVLKLKRFRYQGCDCTEFSSAYSPFSCMVSCTVINFGYIWKLVLQVCSTELHSTYIFENALVPSSS